MLAVRKPGPKPGLVVEEVAEPVLSRDDEVLIDVAAVGICGSDLHVEHWTPGYEFMASVLPRTLGHEFTGRVAVRGRNVTSVREGDRVTVRPGVTCGYCAPCRAGRPDSCVNRKIIGLHLDGAFARRVVAPAGNCLPLPRNLDDEVGALTEPMAVCANALAVADVHAGDRVLVVGPGTIGQGLALFAKRAGAEVTVIGKSDGPRLATLRALGFDRLIDLDEPDAAGKLAEATGDGFERVFEAAGTRRSFEQALAAVALDGVMTAVGILPEPVAIDITRLVRRRAQIRGAHNARPARWPGVVEALAAEPEFFRGLITHRYPLAEALAGFAMANSRQASKVMLHVS